MNSKSEKYGLSEHKQVTNAPEVSSELIQELARMCGLIPSHTTAEWVSTLVRFVRVVLDNNSVQEAFVRANAGLLAVSPGLPEQSDYYKGWYAGLLDSEKRGASRAMLTDEQIDMIWEATRETLPQPVSEAFAMRAFARALLAAQPPAAAEADARDAARYRVLRQTPSFAITMGQFSTPGIIDALCDKAIAAAAPQPRE